MTLQNPYSPPASRVDDVSPVEESPPLWNPRVAANWSLLFSPVFGALVHMKNWQALGETEEAAKSKNWAIGSLIFLAFMALLAAFLPDSKVMDLLTRLTGLVLLIVWYYASGKPQYRYVLTKFGTKYKKKGWSKPLLCAIGGLLGFMVVMGLLGFALGAFAA